MLDSASPIRILPGLGPRRASSMARLGVSTIWDLLFYLPRAYDDLSKITPISKLTPDKKQVIRAKLLASHSHFSPRRRLHILEAILQDGSGQIKAIWFNQPYLQDSLLKGNEYFFVGTPKLSGASFIFGSSDFEAVSRRPLHSGRIVPVYPEVRGISSKFIRGRLRLLSPLILKLTDHLESGILEAYRLLPLSRALNEIHFPTNFKSLEEARQRLSFDELLFIQLAVQRERRRFASLTADPIPFDERALSAFEKQLPFALTGSQREALLEILHDLAKDVPMNRLLQGDVGSGKTAVAALAALQTIYHNSQVALMAPTEVLAYQHYQTLKQILFRSPVKLALLTRSFKALFSAGEEKAPSRSELLARLKSGEIDLTIGTHALIQKGIEFKKLGLVIVDEQHRFGVKQRQSLKYKGAVPHFLSLTATPIPRTLALSIYGNLDLSSLREMPQGRQIVKTLLVPPGGREDAYKFIQQQVKVGRQAFIITPLIDISEKLVARAATEEFKRLKKIFPRLRLGLLHGKLKAVEKESVLNAFAQGKTQVLVSTSVVEVGIDVPNASVMMIESAERFGLAQLHQLRGRVGRGPHQSFCLLFTDQLTSEVKKRLAAFARLRDGFALAELDLKLRGPGNFLGPEQSGFLNLKVAQLNDIATIEATQKLAQKILDEDPKLQNHPLLRERIRFQPLLHEE